MDGPIFGAGHTPGYQLYGQTGYHLDQGFDEQSVVGNLQHPAALYLVNIEEVALAWQATSGLNIPSHNLRQLVKPATVAQLIEVLAREVNITIHTLSILIQQAQANPDITGLHQQVASPLITTPIQARQLVEPSRPVQKRPRLDNDDMFCFQKSALEDERGIDQGGVKNDLSRLSLKNCVPCCGDAGSGAAYIPVSEKITAQDANSALDTSSLIGVSQNGTQPPAWNPPMGYGTVLPFGQPSIANHLDQYVETQYPPVYSLGPGREHMATLPIHDATNTDFNLHMGSRHAHPLPLTTHFTTPAMVKHEHELTTTNRTNHLRMTAFNVASPETSPLTAHNSQDAGYYANGTNDTELAMHDSHTQLTRVTSQAETQTLQKQPMKTRGPFKDDAKRFQTAHTRKIGSCIRCRMQRIRCEVDPMHPDDDNAMCLTCRKVGTIKLWHPPCRRWKITDVVLSKPGPIAGLEWTHRWKDGVVSNDIGDWASPDIKVLQISEGYTGSYVELRVRRFNPQNGDKVQRTWFEDGETKRLEVPPYALVDVDAAKRSYDDYIRRGLTVCRNRLLGPPQGLLWQTYDMANHRAHDPSVSGEERELLQKTLELWMSIRLTTKSVAIIGKETLGLDPSTWSWKKQKDVPLPPVMGAQIDSFLLKKTLPGLRRETLDRLQTMTQKKLQTTWLTTYLVTFILLHNVSLITRHDAEYAVKHNMADRHFARVDMVREYHLGANILLAYFHYCNKGIYPFSAECKDSELESLAKLDRRAIEFVHFTRRCVAQHERVWRQTRNKDSHTKYSDDFYFTSQLYEPSWMQGETV